MKRNEDTLPAARPSGQREAGELQKEQCFQGRTGCQKKEEKELTEKGVDGGNFVGVTSRGRVSEAGEEWEMEE